MSKIHLIYMKKIYEINLKDKFMTFQIVLNKFTSMINENIKSFYFLYNGKIITKNNNKKICEIIKYNNIKIFVFNLKQNKDNNNELENIICKKCKQLSIINHNDSTIIYINIINVR